MIGWMKGKGVVLVTMAGILATAGCYEHTVSVGGGAPYAPVVYDHWENFWLGGLIGHVRVDVEKMCPSGRATIEAKQTFLNGLVGALTSGIYTPTTVRVRCHDGRRVALELSGEDVATLVADDDFTAWVAAELPERADEVARAQQALAQP